MQIEPWDYRRFPTFPLSFAGMNADTLSIIGTVIGTTSSAPASPSPSS